jgi:hypothetical protein
MDWITAVVIRGGSLRTRVPGVMSLVAMSPFPLPGIVSTLHKVSSGDAVGGIVLRQLDLAGGEVEGGTEVVLGAMISNDGRERTRWSDIFIISYNQRCGKLNRNATIDTV